MRALRALALVAAATAARRRTKRVREERAADARDFYRNATALGPVKTVAAVVLSHNHETTVKRIADALSDEVDAIVVVEDGSTDNSYEAWRAALQEHKNARIIQTPDVHEIRAYNRGAAIANADVYCFLQDDDVPNDRGWGTRVMSLMDSFRKQRLAVLSGLATEVCQSEWGEVQVEHPKQMKNPRVTRRIPYAFRGVPFAFAPVHTSKCRGAVVLNRHVHLHAIDATPARWPGDAGSPPLDGASAAASSPRNGLVKNCRVHPTHGLISTQVGGGRRVLWERRRAPSGVDEDIWLRDRHGWHDACPF